MKSQRKFLFACIVICFIFLFTQISTAAEQTQTFKVGIILTLSGPMAAMGTMQKDGYEFAKEDINAKGGVMVGGKRYPLELIYFDDEATPKKAVDATNVLISKHKVPVIMGVRMNEAVEAVQGITEKKKVILVTDVASYPGVFLGKKYGFLMSDSGWTESMAAVRLLTEDPGVLAKHGISPEVDKRWDFSGKKVAYLGREEMYCLYGEMGLKEGLQEFGKKKNIQYVGSMMYPIGTDDVTPYIQRLMAMKPDIIYHALYLYEETYKVLRALKEMGYDYGPNGNLLTVNANDDYNWKHIMEPLVKEGILLKNNLSGGVDMPLELVEQYPMRKAFFERSMKKLNRPPSLFEDCGYDSLMMLAQAVEKANSITDTDKIREALLNINYDGVRGPGQTLVNPRSVPALNIYQEQIVQPQYWRIVVENNQVKYTGLKYKAELYWGRGVTGEKLLHQ